MNADTLDGRIARKRARALDDAALQTLFIEARTARGFLDRPVPAAVLERMVELSLLGPTSSNTQPMRVLFVTSSKAKARLRPLLSAGNVEKTLAAPVTAIVAADVRFYDTIERLGGRASSAERFAREPEVAAEHARLNATLQGAYLMLAARALGLDVGPMGGFDRAGTDAAFFSGTSLQSLWLINLGYADDAMTPPRAPRLNYAEVARTV